MSRIKWDQTGERLYETGVDRGVLAVMGTDGKYGNGVAWNGLTAVNESPEGAEPNALYADNIKYLNLVSNEEYKATVECYTYPDEFAECNGEKEIATGVSIGQQSRKSFAYSYRTKIGNDVDGSDHGYKIHVVYGATASPSSKDYATINDSPEAITFSYEISTTPVDVTGAKPTATVVIDSTKVAADKLKALEDVLYGTDSEEPIIPLPDEIATICGETGVSETPAVG